MADKLMYIPNDNTQSYPFCRLQFVVETFEHLTYWTNLMKVIIMWFMYFLSVIERDKTMAEKLMYIPNDDTQHFKQLFIRFYFLQQIFSAPVKYEILKLVNILVNIEHIKV